MEGKRPRAVIAEDEAVLRGELRSQIATLWPDLEVVASVADGNAALAALEKHRPDILFLDIQMPGLSGVEVAHRASGRCHVVFVTAHDEFAVTAFEEGAVDYVMKPVTAARLGVAIERVKSRLAAPPASLEHLLNTLAGRLSPPRGWLRWINASLGNDLRLITVDEVCYFRSDAKYTKVVTASQESLIRKPIRELAEELDPEFFWQVHRSIIVNASEIAGMQRDFGGRIQLRLKHRPELLPVSQPYSARFRQM
jgi:DNA-binding LytR/AlgR family response regulator